MRKKIKRPLEPDTTIFFKRKTKDVIVYEGQLLSLTENRNMNGSDHIATFEVMIKK